MRNSVCELDEPSQLGSIQEMALGELIALRDQIDAEILRKRGPPLDEEDDIGEIGLTTRAENVLRTAGIEQVGTLLALSEARLRRLPGLGLGSLVSIKESLRALGLSLRSKA